MFKTLLFSFFVFSCSFLGAQNLKEIVRTIESLPEAKALMDQIYAEGPFSFIETRHKVSDQFGALWDFSDRVIVISPSHSPDPGKSIGSIVFELHNAAVSKQLNHLFDRAEAGTISRAEYIEEIERLEYHNSKKASAMVKKGIDKGLFPHTAHLGTYNSFEEHFYYQQYGGHSQVLGELYDRIRQIN